MIRVRKSAERGHFDHGWLDTYHTFSFARYYDRGQMGFRALRVINEDKVAPGRGFGTHPHEDMEIITYVLEGGLAHKDSLGTGSVVRPGELQRITAGTGVTHSEFNESPTDSVHLYQIWLLPEREGLAPSYEQKAFTEEERLNQLRLVASREGSHGSLTIHQDASLSLATLEAGRSVEHAIGAGRHAWLQVLRGQAEVNGVALAAGDGAAASEEAGVVIGSEGGAEVLLFDLG